jgi:hypothetical protein
VHVFEIGRESKKGTLHTRYLRVVRMATLIPSEACLMEDGTVATPPSVCCLWELIVTWHCGNGSWEWHPSDYRTANCMLDYGDVLHSQIPAPLEKMSSYRFGARPSCWVLRSGRGAQCLWKECVKLPGDEATGSIPRRLRTG